MLKAFKYVFSICLVIGLILVFIGDKIIEKIIFRPTKLSQAYVFSFEKPFDEFYLKTAPNVKINIIRLKSEIPKGAIIYFHGNKDNLQRWGEIASHLTDFEYDVFVMDYRGYGKSTGHPSEAGILSDAEAIFTQLKAKYNYSMWIFYGRSMGSGVASYLTSKYDPDGLILETPYYSMEDLISYYFFPYRWYDQRISFLSYKYLQQSNCPVLILHGTADCVIPVEQGEKLFHSVGQSRAIMVKIEGGTHKNLGEYQDYHKAVGSFLDNVGYKPVNIRK